MDLDSIYMSQVNFHIWSLGEGDHLASHQGDHIGMLMVEHSSAGQGQHRAEEIIWVTADSLQNHLWNFLFFLTMAYLGLVNPNLWRQDPGIFHAFPGGSVAKTI